MNRIFICDKQKFFDFVTNVIIYWCENGKFYKPGGKILKINSQYDMKIIKSNCNNTRNKCNERLMSNLFYVKTICDVIVFFFNWISCLLSAFCPQYYRIFWNKKLIENKIFEESI